MLNDRKRPKVFDYFVRCSFVGFVSISFLLGSPTKLRSADLEDWIWFFSYENRTTYYNFSFDRAADEALNDQYTIELRATGDGTGFQFRLLSNDSKKTAAIIERVQVSCATPAGVGSKRTVDFENIALDFVASGGRSISTKTSLCLEGEDLLSLQPDLTIVQTQRYNSHEANYWYERGLHVWSHRWDCVDPRAGRFCENRTNTFRRLERECAYPPFFQWFPCLDKG